MRRLQLALSVSLLLLGLAAGATAVGWLREVRAVDQRGSVTEGVVTQVRDRFWRDQVVVQLDQLDGRPIVVTQDGRVRVGQRLQVEYDPDGPAVGRVAGSDRDRRDARLLLLGAAAGLVVVGALTPWRSASRRRRPRDPGAARA